ncbi:MAG: DUF4375 domain-containing protein [Terracidiphilus sp.]|jgi:hypothetical protein
MGNGPEAFAAAITSIPRSSVLLFSAHTALAEVHNGGFLQLFWNSAGVLVPEAIEGFTTIGMPTMAAILQEAAQPLGKPYPRDRDERWDALLAASGKNAEEIEQIFERAQNFYLGFHEACLALPFDRLNQRFWDIAKTENGGFQDAATQYAQAPFLIQ